MVFRRAVLERDGPARRSALKEAFELVAFAEIMAGVVLDSPMRWRAVERIDPYLGFEFPVRYERDAEARQWLLRKDYSASAWE